MQGCHWEALWKQVGNHIRFCSWQAVGVLEMCNGSSLVVNEVIHCNICRQRHRQPKELFSGWQRMGS
jgi:hypothetical protein